MLSYNITVVSCNHRAYEYHSTFIHIELGIHSTRTKHRRCHVYYTELYAVEFNVEMQNVHPACKLLYNTIRWHMYGMNGCDAVQHERAPRLMTYREVRLTCCNWMCMCVWKHPAALGARQERACKNTASNNNDACVRSKSIQLWSR